MACVGLVGLGACGLWLRLPGRCLRVLACGVRMGGRRDESSFCGVAGLPGVVWRVLVLGLAFGAVCSSLVPDCAWGSAMTTVLDQVQVMYVVGGSLVVFLLAVIAVGTWRR